MPSHYHDDEYKGSEHATDVFRAPKKEKTAGQELEESGEYTQDPEQEDLSQQVNYSTMEDIYARERRPGFDREMEAIGKAKAAGNLTDQELIEAHKRAKRIRDAEDEIDPETGWPMYLAKGAWWLMQKVGEGFDWVDDQAGIPGTDIDVYHARRKILDPLSETHLALGILGEIFLPDSIDIATAGFSYIPNRFRKAGKAGIKLWAKLQKAGKTTDDINIAKKGAEKFANFQGKDVEKVWQEEGLMMAIKPDPDDGYSYRKGRPLKNPIYDNLSPKVQKGFADAGINSDKATFFIENWNREVGANVEGFPFTDRTFEFMQSELLPKILEDMKGINLSDGLQLDHIAQLKAMTPFYQGRNLQQAEKIRRILIKEGIFGGHNPKNLKYLPTDVHTVKTNFWKQNVGDSGEKFFEGRPMKTYADVEKAAKEMKLFINRSNDIVEKVSEQYKFMRKKKISAEELDKILKKVDLNYGTYNLKDVRKLIKEDINVDQLTKSQQGLEDAKEAAEAVEFNEKKTYLPHEIEDVDPADLPKRKRVRRKKPTLQRMAEKAQKAEEKRLKKLGGQEEINLDE